MGGDGAGAFRAAWAEGHGLRLDEAVREAIGAEPEPDAAAAAARSAAPFAIATGLHVGALGPFTVELDGAPVPADSWAYAKPKELLVHLLLHPAGRTREQIGQAMWPGSSTAQAKNSFHVTLHHLRKALGGADSVVIDHGRYRLPPGLATRFDAAEFESAARAVLRSVDDATPADIRAALALYRGDLLQDEVAGGWVEDERDRLRRLFVDLSLALGDALEKAGELAAAAETWHAITVREELNEQAHRRLMLAWSRSGERARAIRHYERLAALLRDEFEAAPEPETEEVYRRIRGG